jgi:hypothetical protein
MTRGWRYWSMKKHIWTDAQRTEIKNQYARIGLRPGERWPAPPDDFTGEQILELLKRVPDGGGLAGWRAALDGAK